MSNNSDTQEQSLGSEGIHLSSALLASSKFIGYLCDAENALFVDCKRKNSHPAACIVVGKAVTQCAEKAIYLQETHCGVPFRNFTTCLENHANMFKRCKAEQTELDTCVAAQIVPNLGKK